MSDSNYPNTGGFRRRERRDEFAGPQSGVPIISNGVEIGRSTDFHHGLTPPPAQSQPAPHPPAGGAIGENVYDAYGVDPYGRERLQPSVYPYAGGYVNPNRVTNGMAIASFVTGLMGMSIIAIVLGGVSLNAINRNGEGGRGFAIAGMTLGILSTVMWALVVIIPASVVFFTQ